MALLIALIVMALVWLAMGSISTDKQKADRARLNQD